MRVDWFASALLGAILHLRPLVGPLLSPSVGFATGHTHLLRQIGFLLDWRHPFTHEVGSGIFRPHRGVPECVKIFEATFLKGTEIHGGPLFLFHFPVSPSFFCLLFVPPTGGLSSCWHRGMGQPRGTAELSGQDIGVQ